MGPTPLMSGPSGPPPRAVTVGAVLSWTGGPSDEGKASRQSGAGRLQTSRGPQFVFGGGAGGRPPLETYRAGSRPEPRTPVTGAPSYGPDANPIRTRSTLAFELYGYQMSTYFVNAVPPLGTAR